MRAQTHQGYVPAREREQRARLRREATRILRRDNRKPATAMKREPINLRDPPAPGWVRLRDLGRAWRRRQRERAAPLRQGSK
jgi:hypothetical protein